MENPIAHIPVGSRLTVETRGNKTIYTLRSSDDILHDGSTSNAFLYLCVFLFFIWLGGCFDNTLPMPEKETQHQKIEQVRHQSRL